MKCVKWPITEKRGCNGHGTVCLAEAQTKSTRGKALVHVPKNYLGANHYFCIIHSHAVPGFSAPLQSLVYNSTLFMTIFQQSFCHSSNTIAAGAPLFSVLLSWKLRLILTPHFLHVLHKKPERSGRPREPLWKLLKTPSRLCWHAGVNHCEDRTVFITQANPGKKKGDQKALRFEDTLSTMNS